MPQNVTDKGEALVALSKCEYLDCVIEQIDPSLLSDKDFVLALVAKYAEAIGHISSDVPWYKEAALVALTTHGDYFSNIDSSFHQDKDLVAVALSSYSDIYDNEDIYFPDEWLEDKEFAMQLVRGNGNHIRYIDSKLQTDRDIAFAAVEKNISALKYISSDLPWYRSLTLKAIEKANSTIFQQQQEIAKVSNHVQIYKKVISSAMQKDGDIFESFNEDFKSYKKSISQYVKNHLFYTTNLQNLINESEVYKEIDKLSDESKQEVLNHINKNLKLEQERSNNLLNIVKARSAIQNFAFDLQEQVEGEFADPMHPNPFYQQLLTGELFSPSGAQHVVKQKNAVPIQEAEWSAEILGEDLAHPMDKLLAILSEEPEILV